MISKLFSTQITFSCFNVARYIKNGNFRSRRVTLVKSDLIIEGILDQKDSLSLDSRDSRNIIITSFSQISVYYRILHHSHFQIWSFKNGRWIILGDVKCQFEFMLVHVHKRKLWFQGTVHLKSTPVSDRIWNLFRVIHKANVSTMDLHWWYTYHEFQQLFWNDGSSIIQTGAKKTFLFDFRVLLSLSLIWI